MPWHGLFFIFYNVLRYRTAASWKSDITSLPTYDTII